MKTELEIYNKFTKLKEIPQCGYTRADLDMEDPAVARVIEQEALNAKIACLSWILGIEDVPIIKMKTKKELERHIKALDARMETGKWSDESNMSFRHEIRVLRWVLGVGPSDWKM